jgi:hypothetical protein
MTATLVTEGRRAGRRAGEMEGAIRHRRAAGNPPGALRFAASVPKVSPCEHTPRPSANACAAALSRRRLSRARRAAIVSRPFGQLEAAAGRGTGVRAWSTRGVFPGGLRAVPCDVTPLRREAIVMLARSGQGGAAASRSWRCPLSETARTPMRWRRARNHPGTNATTALFVWHSRCRDRRRTSKFANTYRSTSLASRRGPGFLPRVGEEDSP